MRCVASALLAVGVFYFAFMVLDRALSLVYGFNFQPYGPRMPPGFTFYGHIVNGSVAAAGWFVTFRIFDWGTRRGNTALQVAPFIIALTIGALIPYFADASHLGKHGMGHTLPLYIAANDLYVLLFGLATFRLARSPLRRGGLLLGMATIFVLLHFLWYAPRFPEFYWS